MSLSGASDSFRVVTWWLVSFQVTGQDTLSVAASPLLYHAIFNATKEVLLPKEELEQRPEGFHSVYDKWLTSQPVMRNQSTLILYPSVSQHLARLGLVEQYKGVDFANEPHHFHREEDSEPGGILKNYIESASQEIRPHIRPLDMFGSYAPFVNLGGIPSVDLSFVRHSFEERHSENEEFEKFAFNRLPYPLLHTQYDNADALEKYVDPGFAYHKMASQILAEVIRDLSDSLFLPFNLLDYAQLLRDFFIKSNHLHGAIIKEHRAYDNDAILDLLHRLDMSESFGAGCHQFHQVLMLSLSRSLPRYRVP